MYADFFTKALQGKLFKDQRRVIMNIEEDELELQEEPETEELAD
eukprot:gene34618-44750_t